MLHTPQADPRYVDVRAVLESLGGWLVSVSEEEEEEVQALALGAMERVACASGLLSSTLRFVGCLLEGGKKAEEEEEEDGGLFGKKKEKGALTPSSSTLAPALLSATTHLLQCIDKEDEHARGKLSHPPTHPLQPILQAAFDPYELSSSGMTLSEDNTHVRCHTASHSHAYCSVGFKEGKWVRDSSTHPYRTHSTSFQPPPSPPPNPPTHPPTHTGLGIPGGGRHHQRRVHLPRGRAQTRHFLLLQLLPQPLDVSLLQR